MNDQKLFQLYDTDCWGSHSSRSNLGVFDSVEGALRSLANSCDNLIYIFKKENRLFIERIILNKNEGYEQIFDSENDDHLNLFKQILFHEACERFKNDLGFLSYDENDIGIDVNSVIYPEDVTDSLLEEFMNEKDIIDFLKMNFEK